VENCRLKPISEEHTASDFRVLKMDTVLFSENLVSTYKSTKPYNPEEQHRQFHAVKSSNSLSSENGTKLSRYTKHRLLPDR
jgi:hypothetical protein